MLNTKNYSEGRKRLKYTEQLKRLKNGHLEALREYCGTVFSTNFE